MDEGSVVRSVPDMNDDSSHIYQSLTTHRFILEDAPDQEFPEAAMEPVEAMRLIGEDLILDGIPERNLATFVTTWMEPEAQRLISANLHRNFIDHAEYPQTAEI